MCLSDKVANKSLIIFDKLESANGKTKELSAWLKNIKKAVANLKDSKKPMLVTEAKDANLIRAAKNIKGVATISAKSLNCRDLLAADSVLVSVKALEDIEKTFKQVKEKTK